MAKLNQAESPMVNQIKAGTHIDGDIKSDGDLRMDGSLTGTIEVKGRLVVGATGSIDGNISCQNADVSGKIKGKIDVKELLSLKATAKLTGDILTNKLTIEPGANFSGTCGMGGVIKDIKDGEGTAAASKEKAANY